ncbi:hypothetical protein FBU31_002088, partial [Coemansia sp. 'formosensis']
MTGYVQVTGTPQTAATSRPHLAFHQAKGKVIEAFKKEMEQILITRLMRPKVPEPETVRPPLAIQLEWDRDLEDVIYQLSRIHVLLGSLSPKWPSHAAHMVKTVDKAAMILGTMAPMADIEALKSLMVHRSSANGPEIKRLVN